MPPLGRDTAAISAAVPQRHAKADWQFTTANALVNPQFE
jgi:hypothetical protein